MPDFAQSSGCESSKAGVINNEQTFDEILDFYSLNDKKYYYGKE